MRGDASEVVEYRQLLPVEGSWVGPSPEAVRSWGLPGVRCPVCGDTWAVVGLAYPEVDLAGAPFAELLTEPRLAEYSEYTSLRSCVEQIATGIPIRSGAGFGPLILKNPATDGSVWFGRWIALGTQSVVSRFDRNEGVNFIQCLGVGPKLFELVLQHDFGVGGGVASLVVVGLAGSVLVLSSPV
jgi:hypothetical protein